MKIGCVVTGAEGLVEKFNDLNEAIRKDGLIDVGGSAADLVIVEARPNLPVAPPEESTPKGHKPGTLRAKGIGAMVLRRASNGDSVTVGVGYTKRGWYGLFGELGTSRQSAKPVIVPALERQKSAIFELIGSVVSQSITDWKVGAASGAFKPRRL